MARFLGVAVQTDILVTTPVGTAPARVAFFRPDDLRACVATLSPTQPESLTVAIPRDHASAAHVVMGRVVRLSFEGGTDDTEWDITLLDDTSADNVLTITALPIAMRLARVVYMGAVTGTGQPAPDWTGVQLTATEWLNTLVIPQLASAGMAFALGTVDNTTSRFTMDGEWSSLLEIVNAIAEPGRATGEFRLRRDGTASYGYRLDILNTIGGSAATVRVRTAVNLIETKRQRSLVELATRLYARGADTSVATRTMSEHLWRIKTVVSGTTLELEDPFGGAAPILYDNQLNGLYFAALNTLTFASSLVSATTASTQRIVIPSTAGMTAGDLGRFFVGSGANGARVTSLTNPVLADHPADGGYGDRAQILDRPALNADCNLAPNPAMRTWTTSADPADGWAEFADDPTDVTFSQELSDGPTPGVPSFRCVVNGAGNTVFGAYYGGASADALQGPGVAISSPLMRTWKTTGRTHVASVWIKVITAPSSGKIEMYLHDADRATAPRWRVNQDGGTIGTWLEGTDVEGAWIRYESAALNMAGLNPAASSDVMTGRLRVRVEIGTTLGSGSLLNTAGAWQGRWNIATAYVLNDYVSYVNNVYRCSVASSTGNTPPGTDWTLIGAPNRRADAGWEILVSSVTFAESATAIADRTGSGGTELWQSVNAALPTRSSPIKGYDLTVADLEADDATTYASLKFVPGGTVEVTDSDLGVTTPLRLIEYRPDYLRPLASVIRVGAPADLLTALAESGRVVSTLG